MNNFQACGSPRALPTPTVPPSTTFAFWRRDGFSQAMRNGQVQSPGVPCTGPPARGPEPTLALGRNPASWLGTEGRRETGPTKSVRPGHTCLGNHRRSLALPGWIRSPGCPCQWALSSPAGESADAHLPGREGRKNSAPGPCVMGLDSHCGRGGCTKRAGSQGPLSRPGGQSAKAQGRGP